MIKKAVKSTVLILACILLLGIIFMTIGFYNHNSLYISAGISTTLITSLTIFFQNVFITHMNKRKLK